MQNIKMVNFICSQTDLTPWSSIFDFISRVYLKYLKTIQLDITFASCDTHPQLCKDMPLTIAANPSISWKPPGNISVLYEPNHIITLRNGMLYSDWPAGCVLIHLWRRSGEKVKKNHHSINELCSGISSYLPLPHSLIPYNSTPRWQLYLTYYLQMCTLE